MKDLHYDPASGLITRAGNPTGYTRKDGYVVIKYKSQRYLAHRLAWFLTHGYFPENDIDHINRNPSDNRLANLREASRSCNTANSKTYTSNTSGLKGVSFCKTRQKWKARITVNYSTKNLGSFSDKTEAALHRLAAEQCLDWC